SDRAVLCGRRSTRSPAANPVLSAPQVVTDGHRSEHWAGRAHPHVALVVQRLLAGDELGPRAIGALCDEAEITCDLLHCLAVVDPRLRDVRVDDGPGGAV